MDGNVLRIGDEAPEFDLPSANGERVRLSDFRDKAEVVLFFFPRAISPACTVEACSFRDRYEAFREAGAEVIGVSSDPADSQQRFARWFRLPFRLLTDAGGTVRDRYGVPKTFGLFPGRTTFLIDRRGIVRHVFSSQFQPWKHVPEAMALLQKLRAEATETPGPFAAGHERHP